jgi:alginate lyase
MIHINSLSQILVSLTIIIALVCSSIGLLGLLDPSPVSGEEQKLENYTYVDVNNKLPKTIMFHLPSKQTIEANGNQALRDSFERLLSAADSYLTKEPISVMEKKQTQLIADKHDFLSLAPYYWPNLTKAKGLPYVYRDGEKNPEVFSIPDARNMQEMVTRVRILSAAYHLTDNVSYASKASELLRVWFLNNETLMNPNLEHSEVKLGVNNGDFSGIMAGIYLRDLPDAIALISDSGSWTKQDQRGIKLWFSKYFDWLLNSDFGMEEGKSLNNHGTWYDVQVSSLGLFLNKTEISKEILKNYMDKLLAAKIRPDGIQPFEIDRSQSLDYHLFNLQGLFTLAKIGDQMGIDLWDYKTPEGSRLQKELDYLLPYALEKEKWPYEQIKPVARGKLLDVLCQAISHYEGNEKYKQAYRTIDGPKVRAINNLLYGCITGPVNNN